MINYQGKNVIIIGLGVTGLSCVNYFLSKNVIPKVIDTRHKPSGIEQLDPRVMYHTGGLNLDWILDADLIVVSPGIALATPELVKAKLQGIQIIGDIELFCLEVNQQPHKKVAAITGSNGKTTVTSLVGEIIAASGCRVGVGGNIGQPALSLLDEDCDIYVLELSSFQLERTYSLKATAATILNISEDHMDRYPEGILQYTAAKQRIYQNAENCIVNYDDKLTYPHTDAKKGHWIEFGLQDGQYHLDLHNQHMIVNDQSVLDTSQLSLLGVHNYLNILAALAITDALGIERSVSLLAIKNFKGLSHRFELVYEHNGVRWINDSKATNVGSTEAALKSVTCNGTLYLLLGGDGKSADFSPLIPYLLKQPALRIYCFGRDKVELAKLRPDVTTIVDTMKDALVDIAHNTQSGDVVLLSPACASLDQFKNYAERGQVFAMLAKELG